MFIGPYILPKNHEKVMIQYDVQMDGEMDRAQFVALFSRAEDQAHQGYEFHKERLINVYKEEFKFPNK